MLCCHSAESAWPVSPLATDFLLAEAPLDNKFWRFKERMLLNILCAHTAGRSSTGGAVVRLHIMAAIVEIVDSLAAVENAVCASVIVAHCLCVLLRGAKKSMLINTTAPQSLYWPLQTPGILGTIKTSQLQLLAALPPPPHPSPLCCLSPLPLLSLLKQRDKARPPMTVILGLTIFPQLETL